MSGIDDATPPATPEIAEVIFGGRIDVAEHFVALLATTGISHGLIGPREGPRLWDRHLLNCAVVQQLISSEQSGQRVIDVGSGAGLPGLPIAIARPELEVHLVEPLARRTAWLTDTVAELGLDNVIVHTTRAESLWGTLQARWVTARAVTTIVKLAQWCFPLLEGPGSLLAIKGSRAVEELADSEVALRRLGAVRATTTRVGDGVLEQPTVVLRVDLATPVDSRRFRRYVGTSAGSARRRADRRRSHSRPEPARNNPPPQDPASGRPD